MKKISDAEQLLSYSVRRSNRAKRMSFVVHWDGRAELVIPTKAKVSERKIFKFVTENENWLNDQIKKLSRNKNKTPLSHRGVPKERVEQRTVDMVWYTIEEMCEKFPFRVKKIKTYPYKSRWGSCDQDGVLCFHYKLSLLPDHLLEYVVVHELCHTKHLNHSKDFWAFVSEFCPDYKSRRRELRNFLI